MEAYAYPLKTLEEAVALKNHIIRCFEVAAGEKDEAKRRSLLTFVIVGGGATGVEFAGALSELVHGSLRFDYPSIDFNRVRIILVEASNSIVANMPASVQAYTLERMQKMRVNVYLGATILEVTRDSVILSDREKISTQTVIWSAGVRGEPVAGSCGITAKNDGRVPVLPTLQVPGCPEIYVIGDLAAIAEGNRILPMVAQVAIQSGIAAATNIRNQISGKAPVAFRYRDRGSMIAIGRNAAGVAIGPMTYTGFFAWMLWLFVHLFNLIGFRNRLMVLVNWAWDYLFYERAVRFIFPADIPPYSDHPEQTPESTCSK
jgi:NADH dehydrogenase